MFNVFESLFSLGRKHTEDENRRLEMTREQLGDADPGRGPIDLGSGKVTMRGTPSAPDARAVDGAATSDPAAPEGTTPGTADLEGTSSDPTAEATPDDPDAPAVP